MGEGECFILAKRFVLSDTPPGILGTDVGSEIVYNYICLSVRVPACVCDCFPFTYILFSFFFFFFFF